jgi:predicted nuclease with TOPRIM domain
MPETYCGIGKTPKGQRLGTMRECAESGQIRLYGLRKIDPKLIELVKKKGSTSINRNKVIKDMVGLRGKIKGLKRKIDSEKDNKEKKKMKKELEKLEADLDKVQAKYKEIEKDRRAQQKGGSRKGSRSRSRSRSRKGSKKGSIRR